MFGVRFASLPRDAGERAGFGAIRRTLRGFRRARPKAAQGGASDVLSYWKNGRKKRFPRGGKGGYHTPDALYDSQLNLTGFPLG